MFQTFFSLPVGNENKYFNLRFGWINKDNNIENKSQYIIIHFSAYKLQLNKKTRTLVFVRSRK